MELSDWIQPVHLSRTAIEQYRQSILAEGETGVVIDNFFHPHLLLRLSQFAEKEAEYAEVKLLYSTLDGEKNTDISGSVSTSEWENSEENDRFCSRRQVKGVNPEFRLSKNWLTYLKFNGFLKTVFIDYLQMLSLSDLELGAVIMDTQEKGQFLKKHNDYREGRKLCHILYIEPNWKPEYGGGLCMLPENGEAIRHTPVFNRLVLFLPSKTTCHYVEPVAEIAQDKVRKCVVAWYNEQTDK